MFTKKRTKAMNYFSYTNTLLLEVLYQTLLEKGVITTEDVNRKID